MKNTLLIGSFGAKNLGDELILSVNLSCYKKCLVMTADSKFSQNFSENPFPTLPPFPFGIRSWWRFLRYKHWKIYKLAFQKIETIVFPGGGLFDGTIKAYFLWFSYVFWGRFWGGKKVKISFLSQGGAYTKNPIKRFLVQKALKQATICETREPSFSLFLDELKISHKQKEECVYKFFSEQKYSSRTKNAVLVNAKKPIKNWPKIREKFGDKNFLFLVFSVQDKKFCPPEVKSIFPQTKTELLEILQTGEILLGQRLHALVMGVCVLGKERVFVLEEFYADKVREFCQQKQIKMLKIEKGN